MANILVTGAASAIAQATARIWAQRGWGFFLVDRDAERLKIVADDLTVRGAAKVETLALNLNSFDRHEDLLRRALKALGEIDMAFIAHGTLPDQAKVQKDWEAALREFETNFLSAASILTVVANIFEERRRGVIVVIGSVAGDRGRKSNYVYGAAKEALNIFLQGLRNRLSESNVAVVTIKPGFVDTPMTTHFKKGLLWAKPDSVGRRIVWAVDAKKDIVYIPWFWRWIMLVIRVIPERIFKRMSL